MLKPEVEIQRNEFALKGSVEGLQKIIKETLISVHAQAVALAAVKTGRMKNTIMYVDEFSEGGFNSQSGAEALSEDKLTVVAKFLEGYIGLNLDYGPEIEFGTIFMIAQPFLRPSIAVVTNPGKSKEIAFKFGRQAMLQAFNRRKVRIINVR